MRMNVDDFVKFLRQVADEVEAHDSFEGSVTWTALLPGLKAMEFDVSVSMRIGNREGQGGYRIIDPTPPVDLRPENYGELSMEEQWTIDKELGLLDLDR